MPPPEGAAAAEETQCGTDAEQTGPYEKDGKFEASPWLQMDQERSGMDTVSGRKGSGPVMEPLQTDSSTPSTAWADPPPTLTT